jgi:hypothetical protein
MRCEAPGSVCRLAIASPPAPSSRGTVRASQGCDHPPAELFPSVRVNNRPKPSRGVRSAKPARSSRPASAGGDRDRSRPGESAGVSRPPKYPSGRSGFRTREKQRSAPISSPPPRAIRQRSDCRSARPLLLRGVGVAFLIGWIREPPGGPLLGPSDLSRERRWGPCWQCGVSRARGRARPAARHGARAHGDSQPTWDGRGARCR